MKNKKRVTIVLFILIAVMVVSPGNINIFYDSVYAQNEQESISVTEVNMGNFTVTSHKITATEIDELKHEIGVYEKDNESNYTLIIEGKTYFTGLRPPTEEEWKQFKDEGLIIDDISFSGSLPYSIDHSIDPCFPPIGNQGDENSCVCWAIVYYIKTYQEAKEHGWDISKAEWKSGWFDSGQPSIDYQDRIMSPDFVYHQINSGENIGACSWKEMPYDDDDHTGWPSESAWREAPLYRSETKLNTILFNSDEGIDNLKALLAGDNLAVIGIDASQYHELNKNKNLWTIDNYNGGGGHANTVVGYDDNYGPYTEEGENRYGAFKIVNSWGTIHSTYWISYEAMKRSVKTCYFFIDKIDYQPKLVSVFQIEHLKRSDCVISLQFKDTTSSFPITIKTFDLGLAGPRPFPKNKIVFDITEYTRLLSDKEAHDFILSVLDRGGYWGTDTGIITYFSIEYYDDYSSQEPTIFAISDDTPVTTINDEEVTAEIAFPSINNNVNLYTDKSLYYPGENVGITVNNTGDAFLLLSKWYIEKRTLGSKWEKIYESSKFSDDTSTIYPFTNNTTPVIISPYGSINGSSTIYPFTNNTPIVISPYGPINNSSSIYPFTNNTPIVISPYGPINPYVPINITPYETYFTLLYPSQQISWNWSQINADGKSSGLGEFRVKVEYGDKHVCSDSFSIAYYLLPKGTYFNETSLIVFNLSETPSLVTNGLSFSGSLYVYDGFLIDFENDGTYDSFQSLVYEKRTDVTQDAHGNYLIDTDGDGKWEYTYNPANGESTIYASTNNDRGTPGFELVLAFLAVIVVSILLLRKKK